MAQALEPFPLAVPTLDEFLRSRGQTLELASYDDRLVNAAIALGIVHRKI